MESDSWNQLGENMANLLNSIIYYLKDAVIKDENGNINVRNVITPNACGVAGTNTNGDLVFALTTSNANNNLTLGYGQYNLRDGGHTNIYGDEEINLIPNGNIKLRSSVYVDGATHSIGERVHDTSAASHSWNSSTDWVALETVTLTKGVYIMVGNIQYPSNTNGRRGAQWYNQTSSSAIGHSSVVVAATNGVCYVQTVAIVNISSDSYTFRLRGLQNSGSNLAVTSYARVVAIA